MDNKNVFDFEITSILSGVKNIITPEVYPLAMPISGITPETPKTYHRNGDRKFNHILFKTKYYQDESCAVYKTVSMFRKLLDGVDSVFIRRFPYVNKFISFDRESQVYFGCFRVSIEV